MSQRTCETIGCERTHYAKGGCRSHYNQAHQPDRHPSYTITCETCGGEHTTGRTGGRFCSLTCRDVWSIAAGTRTGAPVGAQPTRYGGMRRAYETQEWAQVMAELESLAVKVDDCWLWPRRSKRGYGTIRMGKRNILVHRLAATASLREEIPSHMPVHHKCAETLCFNPLHLQVVTPHENAAEMLERNHYIARIVELESAIHSLAPDHPLITQRIHLVA